MMMGPDQRMSRLESHKDIKTALVVYEGSV